MKTIITILFIGLALNSFAGTGGISSITGVGNGRIDAGTGGVVGGVDDLDELKSYDWTTIRKYVDKNYKLDLAGDIAFVGKIVSVFDVCINNDQVRTIKKLPVYKRVWQGGSRENERFKDIEIGKKFYSYPILSESEERRCFGKRDNNCKIVKVVKEQNLSPKITLRKDVSRNHRNDRQFVDVFSKNYDIPYCK